MFLILYNFYEVYYDGFIMWYSINGIKACDVTICVSKDNYYFTFIGDRFANTKFINNFLNDLEIENK